MFFCFFFFCGGGGLLWEKLTQRLFFFSPPPSGHVISAFIVTELVYDQLLDQCMISHVISA